MTLEQGYFITQIIAGIVLIASILFLALQVRQNAKILEKVMNEDYQGHRNILFDQISFSQEFAEFYHKVLTDYDSLSDIEKFRASFIARRGVRSMMQSVYTKLSGNLSDEQFELTKDSISSSVRGEHIRSEWTRVKDLYSLKAQGIWDFAITK